MSTGTIKFHCTICGAAHSIPAEQAGVPFHCESCRNITLAPLKSEEPLPVSPPTRIEPPSQVHDTSQPTTGTGDTETYSLAAEYTAEGPTQGEPQPAGSWPDPLDMPPPVRPRKRRPRPIPSIVDSQTDPSVDPGYLFADELISLFQGLGRWIILGLAILIVGNVLKLMNPDFTYLYSAAFMIALAAMMIAAWMLLHRHAVQHDPDATSTLLWPPNFIRYGIENWPETRRSMQIFGLATLWVAASWIVAIPFDMLSSVSTIGKSQVAGNPQPPAANAPQMMPVADIPVAQPADAPAAAEKPPAGGPPAMPPMQAPPAMPAVPANATLDSIRSVSRQVAADGTITTTSVLIDGSVRTTVTRTQSGLKPTADDLRRQAELNQKVNAAENKVGDVIETPLTGTDTDLVWGGKDGIYARGSSPGSAAVHAGVVKLDETAKVKITITAPLNDYPALDQNGVSSLAQGPGTKFSFKIERIE